MKVNVIPGKCIGCGYCGSVCPDVFEVQDDGLSHVINENIDESLQEGVKDAADGCPTEAIEIEA